MRLVLSSYPESPTSELGDVERVAVDGMDVLRLRMRMSLLPEQMLTILANMLAHVRIAHPDQVLGTAVDPVLTWACHIAPEGDLKPRKDLMCAPTEEVTTEARKIIGAARNTLVGVVEAFRKTPKGEHPIEYDFDPKTLKFKRVIRGRLP